MPVTQIEALSADADGEEAKTAVYVDGIESDMSAGDAATYHAAVQGMSAIDFYALVGHVYDETDIGATTSNDYGAADKVTFYGRSATGQDVETSIPAPLEANFGADAEAIDLTTGAGATIKAALELVWKGPDGSAVTIVSAERTRPTRKR